MASVRYIVDDIDKSVDFYRDRPDFKVDMHNLGKFAAYLDRSERLFGPIEEQFEISGFEPHDEFSSAVEYGNRDADRAGE